MRRAAPWFAGAFAALGLALLVAYLLLGPRLTGTPELQGGQWTDDIPHQVLNAATTLVGAVLVARRPRNPIGWLIAVIGLSFSTYPVLAAALATQPVTPRVTLLAWTGNWVWVPGQAALILMLLLFPDGTLPSRRWRPVALVAVVTLVALLLRSATFPDLEALPGVGNPFTVDAATGLFQPLFMVMDALRVLAAASLVVRFLRARETERQQLKWVALGVGVYALQLVSEEVVDWPRWLDPIGPVAALIGVGVAVTRYRLYDIDRVISRTFSYGLLTAALAGVYVAGVTLLAPLFGDSDLAVAGSTLAVAALFGPARRRVQGGVDRRFNRARFDARRTLESFSTRLRDEVDLDQLSVEMLAVVGQTLQPARVALWLRR